MIWGRKDTLMGNGSIWGEHKGNNIYRCMHGGKFARFFSFFLVASWTTRSGYLNSKFGCPQKCSEIAKIYVYIHCIKVESDTITSFGLVNLHFWWIIGQPLILVYFSLHFQVMEGYTIIGTCIFRGI